MITLLVTGDGAHFAPVKACEAWFREILMGKPYITWVSMRYHWSSPRIPNTVNTIGTRTLGVHPSLSLESTGRCAMEIQGPARSEVTGARWPLRFGVVHNGTGYPTQRSGLPTWKNSKDVLWSSAFARSRVLATFGLWWGSMVGFSGADLWTTVVSLWSNLHNPQCYKPNHAIWCWDFSTI